MSNAQSPQGVGFFVRTLIGSDPTLAELLSSAQLRAYLAGSLNMVQYVNASDAPAAGSLTTSAPAISAKGSGAFQISAAACPFATGAPAVIGFALFRDMVQLPPRHKNTDTGPGNHSPDVIVWVDAPGDTAPHVYSLVATPNAGQIADSANHQWITVVEL